MAFWVGRRRHRHGGRAAVLTVWSTRPIDPVLLAPPAPRFRLARPLQSWNCARRTGGGSLRRAGIAARRDGSRSHRELSCRRRSPLYRHGGVDLRAAGPRCANLVARRTVSGASTITMQLARMLRPIRRTWLGKAEQAVSITASTGSTSKRFSSSISIACRSDKARSASMHGGGALFRCFGARRESRAGGAPRRPRARLRAAIRSCRPAGLKDRRGVALRQLVKSGYADDAAAARAAEPPLERNGSRPFLAPHFDECRPLDRARRIAGYRYLARRSISRCRASEADVGHTVTSP